MEKCSICQYYDRQPAKTGAGAASPTGQCRRTAPNLHPINAKTYMIEGVWPTVRDDDWCGEWKVLVRRVGTRFADALDAPSINGMQSLTPPAPHVGPLTGMGPVNGSGNGTAVGSISLAYTPTVGRSVVAND